jgi:hypothetical protein
MPNVKRIDTVKTGNSKHCAACDAWIDGDKFQESVNHYLEHGWVFPHVGEETQQGANGFHHLTVAVVGEPA